MLLLETRGLTKGCFRGSSTWLVHLGQLRTIDDCGQLAIAWQNSLGLGEGTETEASPEGKERSGAFLAFQCATQGTSFCFILGGVLMKLAYFDGGS